MYRKRIAPGIHTPHLCETLYRRPGGIIIIVRAQRINVYVLCSGV